jgi:DNA replication and repair protein RecF
MYNTPMTLQGIWISHVRSHAELVLNFTAPTTLIVGPNASGKTTIVEVINLLSTGESFRASKIDELIQFGAELGRLKAKVGENEADPTTIEIIITHGQVQGQPTAKRLYSLNGVRRLRKTAVGQFLSVVFRPEDMRLIEGSPARRRSFIDAPLSLVSREYAQSLHIYEQTLLRRNRLLLQIRDRIQPISTLSFWDMSLVKHGQILQRARQEFLHSYSGVEFPVSFITVYLPSVISEERLKEYQNREIAAGHTLIGPHKDDFGVEVTKQVAPASALKSLNVAQYGSRGEQRLAVLWLKFGELKYLQEKTGQKPILLLDDILSELDADSQNLALSVLPNYQSVITTTDLQLQTVIKEKTSSMEVIKLPITSKTSKRE